MVGSFKFVIIALLLNANLSLGRPRGISGQIKKMFRGWQESYFKSRIDKVRTRHEIVFQCGNAVENRTLAFQDNDTMAIQGLDSAYPLSFFIHGWKNSIETSWVKEVSEDWTRFTNTTVCIVDWGALASKDYINAAMNMYDVGRTVADVIESLESHGFHRQNITIVGYSLGAHIAGYTGQLLNGQLGQIIGLDPAGPLLTLPAIVAIEFRLDETDAKFVQVMHTSGGTLGTHVKCGHSDFYPNGGTSPQSSCVPLQRRLRRKLAVKCSHSTAVEFFKNSMDPQYQLVGYNCESYRHFIMGKCNQNTLSRFGVHSDRELGNFYFSTNTVFVQQE